MQRRLCHFSGDVQGVGFRYTVQNVAMQHDVQGYVKNLPDGRVELLMEGPDPEMDRVFEEVKQRMNNYIRNVNTTEMPATGEYQQFYIRH